MSSESLIMREIRLELGKIPEVVLWRNNVGSAEYVSPQGDVQRVSYGLCPGSSDLIGIIRGSGRFLALEVKRPGEYPTKQQRMFLALVTMAGGVGAVVTSVDDALRVVKAAITP